MNKSKKRIPDRFRKGTVIVWTPYRGGLKHFGILDKKLRKDNLGFIMSLYCEKGKRELLINHTNIKKATKREIIEYALLKFKLAGM